MYVRFLMFVRCFDTVFQRPYRYFRSPYSQARSNVPLQDSINEFIIQRLNPLVSCRLQIRLCIIACVMSREFTRDSVTKFPPAQFPWIWCKCLLRNLMPWLQNWFYPFPIGIKFSPVTDYKLEFVKIQLSVKSDIMTTINKKFLDR